MSKELEYEIYDNNDEKIKDVTGKAKVNPKITSKKKFAELPPGKFTYVSDPDSKHLDDLSFNPTVSDPIGNKIRAIELAVKDAYAHGMNTITLHTTVGTFAATINTVTVDMANNTIEFQNFLTGASNKFDLLMVTKISRSEPYLRFMGSSGGGLAATSGAPDMSAFNDNKDEEIKSLLDVKEGMKIPHMLSLDAHNYKIWLDGLDPTTRAAFKIRQEAVRTHEQDEAIRIDMTKTFYIDMGRSDVVDEYEQRHPVNTEATIIKDMDQLTTVKALESKIDNLLKDNK